MSFQDSSNLLFVLPVERIVHDREHTKRIALEGWQIFLSEARKRFLTDLISKNGLVTSSLNGEVLEIDGGPSRLRDSLKIAGLRTITVDLQTALGEPTASKYGLGVSHNQLEHFRSLDDAEKALYFLGNQSVYGMVNQVHAVDDPYFNWDKTHRIKMTSQQWEEFFRDWAKRNENDEWTYLGGHRGAPGRPKNFVLERNGNLPFYSFYEEQAIRKIVAELTVANGISLSRIPLLILALSIGKDKPYLLSGMLASVHALDALDGYVARKGLGNSPFGPMIDVLSDHFVEAITMFEYAYDRNFIPRKTPWIITARNISSDILRLHNAFRVGVGTKEAHPHEAFGTNGEPGRKTKFLYGLTKALGDMTIPIIPKMGIYLSGIHVGFSIARAMPVWTSPTSQQIYKDLMQKILSKKK